MSERHICPRCGEDLYKWAEKKTYYNGTVIFSSADKCTSCDYARNEQAYTDHYNVRELSDFGFTETVSMGDFKRFDRFHRMETPLGKPLVSRDTILIKGRKVTYLPNGQKSQIVPPNLWDACMIEAERDGVEGIINTRGLRLKEQDAPISEAEWLEEAYGLDIFKKENEDNE